eukprot:TRINITY_DN3053_c0_g1_i1.p1 TRINITY_DN3053_c0_g1~~TRINITY_DN3053_c0_g1_i1.p1  ORF type:complete len:234 (-),score=76.62 TRINITY_DN3053_c0_g1_i1:156-857(-)
MEALDVISLCEGQTDFTEMPEEEIPKFVQDLEDSLDIQRKNGELDTANNLELLRYFQMFPTEVKLDQVHFMLGMGLSKAPERDFVTYYSMLSNTIVNDPIVKMLWNLHQKLGKCSFVESWSLIDELEDIVIMIPNFHQSIRSYVLKTMNLTFEDIEIGFLCDCLHLKRARLEEFLSAFNAPVVMVELKGDRAVFLHKEEEAQKSVRNQSETGVFKAPRFQQTGPLFKTLRRSR